MMLDTSLWPRKRLDVLKGIRLDPRNVRLEATNAKVEADILEDLFANEGALSLVEAICRVGFLTHETPVALKRDGEYVMVEGNRRLAALKAIQNPMLVPDYRARISALTAGLQNRASLASIEVMLAPSQDDVDQLVAAIHTSNLRKPWSPGRQAAFFQAQIDAGRTFPELLDRYPTIDVRKFVFRANVINLFRAVQYPEPELTDFLKSGKWARGLSTLARVYESKDFLDLTGLRMDSDGQMSMATSDDVFGQFAAVIVRGMLEGNIDTRSLNAVSSPRFTQLMAELRRIKVSSDHPGMTDEGTSSENNQQTGNSPPRESPKSRGVADNSTEASPSENSTPKSTKPHRAAPVRYLPLGQIRPPDSYPEALKLMLGELSEIDIRKFPNATYLLIRAALEKSIKAFAEARTIDIKTTGHNQNGRVYLSHALGWLLDTVSADGKTALVQVIRGVQTSNLVYTNTSDSLNAVNHNHHFKVDPDQVLAMWTSVDSLMRYLMQP